jgi:hypothetical protein
LINEALAKGNKIGNGQQINYKIFDKVEDKTV